MRRGAGSMDASSTWGSYSNGTKSVAKWPNFSMALSSVEHALLAQFGEDVGVVAERVAPRCGRRSP